MAGEELLIDFPELGEFVLAGVRLTGVKIGSGAYGSVEEVAIPGAICAAKRLHDISPDRSEIPVAEIRRATAQFVKECQLMSTLRHPNIVRFQGVAFFPGSRLPALVMERLLTSLHDLLDPELDPPPPPNTPRPFPLSLKCSVLHNVASGLAYLHELSPPVIHRDLSATNVLLNSEMVAKIVDLGVARIVPRMRAAATMTKGPGASVYMPPEASAPAESNTEKSKYDASIDIFSLGVVTIFTIGETFPCDPLPYTYVNEGTGSVVGRNELERRSRYMACVNQQLCACGQLRGDNPLIRLIQQCLQNLPAKRPSIREVMRLLEEARAETGDNGCGQFQARNQEKADLQSLTKDRDLAEALQQKEEQLLSSEREKETVRQRLILQVREKEEQLARQEAELMRAEETIRREQQQIQEMRQRVIEQQQLGHVGQNTRMGKRRFILHVLFIALPVITCFFTLSIKLTYTQQQLETEIVQCKQHLTHEEQLSSSEGDFQKASQQRDSQPQLTVQCRQKKREPGFMFGGSAANDARYMYIATSYTHAVYQYEFSSEKWMTLPGCPYPSCGLAIIQSELTSVGGAGVVTYTNKLLTLRQGEWVEVYPPMNTARSRPAVVITPDEDYLIVMGGYVSWIDVTATVELFQVQTGMWYTLSDLPQPLLDPSATICGDKLNVIGSSGSGYSCSLQSLPSNDRPITAPITLSWKPLPSLPVRGSTAVTLLGQLVLVGGFKGRSRTNSIHQLVEGQWVEIGSMTSWWFSFIVVSPSPDRILIVSLSFEECVAVKS